MRKPPPAGALPCHHITTMPFPSVPDKVVGVAGARRSPRSVQLTEGRSTRTTDDGPLTRTKPAFSQTGARSVSGFVLTAVELDTKRPFTNTSLSGDFAGSDSSFWCTSTQIH